MEVEREGEKETAVWRVTLRRVNTEKDGGGRNVKRAGGMLFMCSDDTEEGTIMEPQQKEWRNIC